MKKLRKAFREIGEVFAAYGRQGFHELGAVFFGPNTIAQPPQYGMNWTKTPGEVAQGMQGKETTSAAKDAPSGLDAYLHEARAREGQAREAGREDRGLDRD